MCNNNRALRRLGRFLGTLCGPDFKMLVMLVSSVLVELCLQVVESHVQGMGLTIALLRVASTLVLIISLAGILKIALREFTRA